MARILLKARSIPTIFFRGGGGGEEANATAAFFLNHTTTKSVDNMTPFEAWHGRKPDASLLCTFGSMAYVKPNKTHLEKLLEDRNTRPMFIGYEPRAPPHRP